MTTVALVTLFALALLAAIPAEIAARRGLSAAGFWLFGVVGLVPATAVALLVPAHPSRRRVLMSGPEWATFLVVLALALPALAFATATLTA